MLKNKLMKNSTFLQNDYDEHEQKLSLTNAIDKQAVR